MTDGGMNELLHMYESDTMTCTYIVFFHFCERYFMLCYNNVAHMFSFYDTGKDKKTPNKTQKIQQKSFEINVFISKRVH